MIHTDNMYFMRLEMLIGASAGPLFPTRFPALNLQPDALPP